MKKLIALILVLLTSALAQTALRADDAAAPGAAAKQPAAAPPDEEKPAPQALPNDGAVNAEEAEINDFLDGLSAIKKKAADLRAALKGAATPDQKAQAALISGELDKYLKKNQSFINRWLDWPTFVDYSGGLPDDKTVKFARPGCRFAIGDFNEDGKPDLAAVSFRGAPPNVSGDGFYVWLNNGDGTWTESRKNLDTSPCESGGIALTADFNGDGHLDLLFAVPNQPLREYKGDGKGNWEAVDTGVKNAFSFADIHCADMNGDGHIDVVISGAEVTKDQNGTPTSGPSKIFVLENDGTGKFTEKDLGIPLAAGGALMQFVLADVNNDGKIDFISKTPLVTDNPDKTKTSSLAIYLNQGNYKWALADKRPSLPSDAQINDIACADLTGNGLTDIVCAANPEPQMMMPQPTEEQKKVQVYLNDGKGGWRQVTLATRESGFASVDVADVNGDGKPDIILLCAMTGAIDIVLGDGKGGFTESRNQPPAIAQMGAYLKACDIDGDGTADIVMYYLANTEEVKSFHIWRNTSMYTRIFHERDAIRKALAEIK